MSVWKKSQVVGRLEHYNKEVAVELIAFMGTKTETTSFLGYRHIT